MQRQLSPKKQRFLEFIDGFSGINNRPPTFREIMQSLEIKSLGTVNWYVKELEKEGAIRRNKGFNGKRALAVIKEQSADSLPLLGRIAAGYPLEAIENRESIEVPPSYIHPDNFVLQVKGNSMIDDNIQDGDFVIIRQKPDAEPGATIVAIVNNEATLKRYYPKSDGVELHPRNPEYDVIYVTPEDDFNIRGTVLFVFRKYIKV